MVRRRTPNPEIAGSSPVERAFLNFSNPEFRTRTFHMYVLIVSVAFAWIFLQCF